MNLKDFFQKYGIKIIVFLAIVFIVRKFVASIGSDEPSKGMVKIKPKFKYDETKVNRDRKMYSGLSDSHEVAYLQIWLNTYFQSNLKVDGDFGPKTLSALLAATGKSGGSLNEIGA